MKVLNLLVPINTIILMFTIGIKTYDDIFYSYVVALVISIIISLMNTIGLCCLLHKVMDYLDNFKYIRETTLVAYMVTIIMVIGYSIRIALL